MAKARPVEISGDEPFADAARRVLGVRAEELVEHARACKEDPTPDAIHDTRVAARRLRSVLEVFTGALPEKHRKLVLDEVKEALEGLGPARDLDVQLMLVERFIDAAEAPDRRGMRVAAHRITTERELVRSTASEALDQILDPKLTSRVERLAAG
jgi:CHAD domain-containing protein